MIIFSFICLYLNKKYFKIKYYYISTRNYKQNYFKKMKKKYKGKLLSDCKLVKLKFIIFSFNLQIKVFKNKNIF